MAPNHYENMRDASLYEYITPDIVRTISKEQRDIPGGVTEIPLEIQLKKKSMKKLSFNVPWDGILYGFVRGKEILREKTGLTFPIRSITISDWDGHFVLIFETENAHQVAAFYVKSDDVIYLLENCRRVPEQQI